MKLLIGIGTTLLIGASSYAFCPPKQGQVGTVTTVTTTNGSCVALPAGSVSVAKRATEMRAEELKALAGQLDEARVARGSLEAKINQKLALKTQQRALRTAQRVNDEQAKVLAERMRVAGDLGPATEAHMVEAKRAIEAAMVQAEAAASDAACAEAAAEACDQVCEEACADACDEACEAACEEACEAVGDEACAPNASSVTVFGADSEEPAEIFEVDGSDWPTAESVVIAGGSKLTVTESSEDGVPRTRVLSLGGGAGSNKIIRTTTPRARTAVRGKVAPDVAPRRAYSYYTTAPSASGTNGAGEHAQILDQLRALTDEVRALREEVRALRASNRVTETY